MASEGLFGEKMNRNILIPNKIIGVLLSISLLLASGGVLTGFSECSNPFNLHKYYSGSSESNDQPKSL